METEKEYQIREVTDYQRIGFLSPHVVVVAAKANIPEPEPKEGWKGDWAAYIGAGDEEPHDDSGIAARVLRDGSKLPEVIARLWFPQFADIKYRR